MTKVFISYSHKNERWLRRLLVHLRPIERSGQIDLWADTRIKPGANWTGEIESALAAAEVAVLLVSADFLASEFITSRELPSLLLAAKRRACRILSVIVGPSLFRRIQDLQQFQAINSPGRPLVKMKAGEAEEWLAKVAETILDHLAARDRESSRPSKAVQNDAKGSISRVLQGFGGDAHIDDLIRNVKLADWDSAAHAALRVIEATEPSGRNPTFESLLEYQDCSDEDDRLWGALHTIESCVGLAPELISHAQLSRMAEHENLSVRSSAASICMNLAHSAPNLVPLDLLLKLSIYDEDWYVEAPANAALKAMSRSFPAVLRIFYERLNSVVPEERAQAASALKDIAESEPGLLDRQLLRKELIRLKRLGDREASGTVKTALLKLKGIRRTAFYRYGL